MQLPLQVEEPQRQSQPEPQLLNPPPNQETWENDVSTEDLIKTDLPPPQSGQPIAHPKYQFYHTQDQNSQFVSNPHHSHHEQDRSDRNCLCCLSAAPAASVTGQHLHELPRETYSHFFDICDSEEGTNLMAKCKHCGAKVRERVL